MKKIEKAKRIAEAMNEIRGGTINTEKLAKKLAAGMMDRELDMVAKRYGLTW